MPQALKYRFFHALHEHNKHFGKELDIVNVNGSMSEKGIQVLQDAVTNNKMLTKEDFTAAISSHSN